MKILTDEESRNKIYVILGLLVVIIGLFLPDEAWGSTLILFGLLFIFFGGVDLLIESGIFSKKSEPVIAGVTDPEYIRELQDKGLKYATIRGDLVTFWFKNFDHHQPIEDYESLQAEIKTYLWDVLPISDNAKPSSKPRVRVDYLDPLEINIRVSITYVNAVDYEEFLNNLTDFILMKIS